MPDTILTHRHPGAVGMEALEGPANGAHVFKTRRGYGGRCACGWIVLAQSVEATWSGMSDHQAPQFCPYAAEVAENEREIEPAP